MNNDTFNDYYKILGVARDADTETIKKAYRDLMKQYHPDNASCPKETAEAMSKLITEAYQTLRDEEKRKAFDDYLHKKDKKENRKKAKQAEFEARKIKKLEKGNKKIDPNQKESFIKKYWKAIVSGALVVTTLISTYALFGSSKKKNTATQVQNPQTSQAGEQPAPSQVPADTPIGPAQIEIPSQEHIESKPNQEPQQSEPVQTTEPVQGITEPEQNFTQENIQDSNTVLESETAIDNATQVVYNNWSKMTDKYSKETIKELIKFLNNQDSILSIEVADTILVDMLNNAIAPGINNAILGSQAYETFELDFASLLLDGYKEQQAIETMENYLNGAMNEPENLRTYAENAFVDEIGLMVEGKTVDGLNLSSQDDEISSSAKLIWSRLAIGTNGMACTLGNSFVIDVDGTTYTQSDMSELNRQLDSMATDIKKNIDSTDKRIGLK